MGAWKILIPEASTNKVINPVAMGSTGYANIATGAVTLVSTYSYFGYKCFRIVGAADNDGGSFTLSALADKIHYVTLRVNSASDISPMFDISLDNANFHTPTLLATEGNWWVYGAQIPSAQANGSVLLYVLQNGAGAINMFIGHIQVEEKEYATTPVTGDIKGFTSGGYVWNGTPHAASSTRSSQERSGGLEVDLETSYNFRVLYGDGIGMPPIIHHTQSMALIPGAMYVGHHVEPRVLDLVSGIKETTTTAIAHARKHFIEAVKLDKTVYEQPVVFRYYGNTSRPVEFHGVYDSGMEFQLSSGKVDKPVCRFVCYDPFAYELHDTSQVLLRYLSVADADYCMRRINGVWANISTDFNASVYTFTKGKDNGIYIGGGFTNVGAATGDYIVKWNPYTLALSSLTDVTTGLSGTSGAVTWLTTGPNGDIYLTGAFALAGNVANTAYIARWNGVNFLPLATGLTSDGNSMVFGTNGVLYVGGAFTDVTDVNGDYITCWNGAAFSSMGTGMDNVVYVVACAPNGDIYAGGSFHLAGGVANTVHVARWNANTSGVPAWYPLGTGTDGVVTAIAIDMAGNVYIGGAFHNANSVACNHIAKWNGNTFEPLGTGLNGDCQTLSIDDYGLLYAGGSFTTAGDLALADHFAIWNGSTWSQPDIDLPGNPTPKKILPIATSGVNRTDLYIGYDTAGTATTTVTTTIDIPTTNPGSRYVYPVIKIKRADDGTSATLNSIENVTTGKKLLFNYALQKGETLTIDLTPGDRSIVSDFYGDVWRAILRGSDLASFGLLGGSNVISLYVVEVGAPTVVAWMEWRATHWAADTAAA